MVIVINSDHNNQLMDLAEWTQYDWLLQLSDYRCAERLVKNKEANAPITFEEIVMVMIKI